uniref:Uncharacterized protein n=1 Tax=Cacopsylla melanoneura TaxID=428564 RepID=A0A8D9APJ7_9HEMI
MILSVVGVVFLGLPLRGLFLTFLRRKNFFFQTLINCLDTLKVRATSAWLRPSFSASKTAFLNILLISAFQMHTFKSIFQVKRQKCYETTDPEAKSEWSKYL